MQELSSEANLLKWTTKLSTCQIGRHFLTSESSLKARAHRLQSLRHGCPAWDYWGDGTLRQGGRKIHDEMRWRHKNNSQLNGLHVKGLCIIFIAAFKDYVDRVYKLPTTVYRSCCWLTLLCMRLLVAPVDDHNVHKHPQTKWCSYIIYEFVIFQHLSCILAAENLTNSYHNHICQGCSPWVRLSSKLKTIGISIWFTPNQSNTNNADKKNAFFKKKNVDSWKDQL